MRLQALFRSQQLQQLIIDLGGFQRTNLVTQGKTAGQQLFEQPRQGNNRSQVKTVVTQVNAGNHQLPVADPGKNRCLGQNLFWQNAAAWPSADGHYAAGTTPAATVLDLEDCPGSPPKTTNGERDNLAADGHIAKIPGREAGPGGHNRLHYLILKTIANNRNWPIAKLKNFLRGDLGVTTGYH